MLENYSLVIYLYIYINLKHLGHELIMTILYSFLVKALLHF